MMGSLFLLFVVEMWLNAKTGGHTHGGSTGEEFNGHAPAGVQAAFNNPIRRVESYDSQKTMLAARDEKRGWQEQSYPVENFPFPMSKNGTDELDAQSEMPPWFIVFYEQYVRQRDEMLSVMNRAMPALPDYQHQNAPQQTADVSYFNDDDVEKAVDPMVLKKMSMQITLIEGGILVRTRIRITRTTVRYNY
jgi:zinc transporter 1/2/3